MNATPTLCDDPTLDLDPPDPRLLLALGAPPRVDPRTGYAVLSAHPETACRQLLTLMKETP